MYATMRVNPELKETLEQLGSKPKYWFREGDTRLLFKAEERGTGEDWAEKVCCEFAGLLGLPHVHYDLAVEMGSEKPGVVCASCAVEPRALVLGNQLLLALDKDYPAVDARKFKVKAHTVEAVAEALGLIQPPPGEWMNGVPAGIASALDVFTGYVLLDAWTANQDRHHENWGVLWDGKTVSLAPTFDHGAGLARQLTDEERKERLTTKDGNRQVPFFAAKARSAFFEDVTALRPMTTYGAWRAFAARSPNVAGVWRARLEAVDGPTVQVVLDAVPPARMSAVCREFTMALLMENRRRLLADEDE
ncbi:hypothetical protein PHYC_03843 [Phycisphaerales bacterium]|nr:hypothetical protein PHYC_03843 [Phycisphaerales bacterium]